MDGPLPTWLTEVLSQFPVVVLCGVTLWRAARYLDAKHRAELDGRQAQHESEVRTVRELTDRRVEDLKAAHAAQVESMQREIDRLVAGLAETTKDRDRLLRKLAADSKGGDS